jgi:hypothetical protein
VAAESECEHTQGTAAEAGTIPRAWLEAGAGGGRR